MQVFSCSYQCSARFVHQGREEWNDKGLDLLKGNSESYVVEYNARVNSNGVIEDIYR